MCRKRSEAKKLQLKLASMKTFSIKTYSTNQSISQPHFYILNKGLNSGRPLDTPCPNCFILSTTSAEDKDFYFWLVFGLWQSKAFHPYLRGSVIPFITIKELQKVIIQASVKAQANPAKFNKAIASLQQLDLLEKSYIKNLQLIKQARQMVFYKYGS
jgi:hypothetical protein